MSDPRVTEGYQVCMHDARSVAVDATAEDDYSEETIALTYEDKRSGIVVVLRLTPDDASRIGSAILRSVQSLRTLHQGHKP